MASIAKTWDDTSSKNPILLFIDVCLRGVGQVMFQNNPLTGLLFLAGIFFGSAVAGMIQVGIGAVIAVAVGTATAALLRVDQKSYRIGLYGYNAVLVGCALPTFLANDLLMWVMVVIGAAVSTIAFMALANFFKPYGVPAGTFPFVLVSWFLVLAAYAFLRPGIASMGPPAIPTAISASAAAVPPGVDFYVNSFFKGTAQVFLIGNVITGIIFLLALAVSSIWAAGWALVGAVIAAIFVAIYGGNMNSVQAGLYGFSPVLTAIALGCTFYKPGVRSAIYALLGIVFTVIIQAAMDIALTPIGIPTFTAPFNFALYLFLLPKANLAPVQHEPKADPVVGEHPSVKAQSASKP